MDIRQVTETIAMIEQNFDIRTITMRFPFWTVSIRISIVLRRKFIKRFTTKATNLVAVRR